MIKNIKVLLLTITMMVSLCGVASAQANWVQIDSNDTMTASFDSTSAHYHKENADHPAYMEYWIKMDRSDGLSMIIYQQVFNGAIHNYKYFTYYANGNCVDSGNLHGKTWSIAPGTRGEYIVGVIATYCPEIKTAART